jgi:ArsR family transcriptional regulator, cadmium/lead-responsive transcriptional repressor
MTTTTPVTALDVKAKLLRGLADRSRLRVLEALRDGPRCVSDVVVTTGLSQPNVSSHLACLWDCGLVDRDQEGRFVYYRIADPRVDALLIAVEELLITVGDGIYVCRRYGDGSADQSAAARQS